MPSAAKTKQFKSQAWYTLVIPAFRRLRQEEDGHALRLHTYMSSDQCGRQSEARKLTNKALGKTVANVGLTRTVPGAESDRGTEDSNSIGKS